MMWYVRIHRSIEAAIGTRAYRLLRYLMSGTMAAASNLAVLFILVHFGHMYYLYASIVAFVASVVVSFTLQKFWTFQDMFIHDVQAQFVRYGVIVLANLALNTVLMYLFVGKIGLWYLFAQVLTTGIVAIVGYIGYKHFVFRDRPLTP